MSAFKDYLLSSGQRTPLVIEQTTQPSLSEFIRAHSDEIHERLITHGALLFRGFAVNDIRDFDAFVAAVSPQRMDYCYGSTPRTALGGRIFTATEYPENLEIPLHNENSYQRTWPLKIALCCLVPATEEGETPIADMRKVNAALRPELMEKFEQKRVRYVRHYRPFIDVPWQKVFQTDDRATLARFCAEHDIQHEWLDEETLRTSQICQGAARHPLTGERVFFNQAHLFHLSSLGAKAADAFSKMYGSNVPRQTYFGDGSEIPAQDLEAVRSAFNSAKIVFPWARDDVLLLDNMQVAHGRRPYKGPRKVVVALMEPHQEQNA
ncbi:MAG TPA: TauD/TfdA family dioxygenase [Steroidobacteraceae bacterium]|nr:TauD/TfdA family dioxygenase [Steroidobacteraceae bacterium]